MQTLRYSSAVLAVVVSISVAATASGQTLAQRIAEAPDGVVRLQTPSRAGTCGDGREVIGYQRVLFAASFQTFGKWHTSNCRPGPVMVELSVSGRKVTRARTTVGGTWRPTTERVTDLGTVSPAEAAAFFFSIMPSLEGAGDKSRVLLPAVLPDAGDVTPQLTSLARDESRKDETRRQAIQWLGIIGDAKVVPTLVAFARDGGAGPAGEDFDEDDGKPGRKGLGTAAMAALSFIQNGVGVPALIDLARNGRPATRGAAVFWLGQSGDPRAFSTLHGVIENAGEDPRIRAHAIFSLSHGDEVPASEYAYLRSIFPRLGADKLRDAVLMGMAEDKSNGAEWLLGRARDTRESMHVRKQALFWAGQRDYTPTAELAAFYRSASEASLKEHAIFVLSQRSDDAAIRELLRIAREDSSKEMRSRALFWLAQKDDPRVAKLIDERISR